MTGPPRAALVVLSDKASSGTRLDACLPVMRENLPPGCVIVSEEIMADDRRELESLLKLLCDRGTVDVVFTAGGTGLSPRDVTPQATLAIADYEVPGIAEAMRQHSASKVPTAILSRAVAVVRKRTLIVNLPGSPKAVRETLAIINPVLRHAFELLRGSTADHPGAG
ncbi:MAG: MogA/MoaB family molybdenum cofactor biosynthesis protein [Candidatus Eremiobacteraeota bacterium]|nr:MogA/MoaB family molybdenum cofactor biosynthesis protein [Candidatus Eremiobacteraeota bacterium]